MLIYIRTALLVIGLLFSFHTQATAWLLRIDSKSANNVNISADAIFNFSNGDSLYTLEEEQLSQLNLNTLFKQPGFRYLQPDITLLSDKSKAQPRAASVKNELIQNFLLQDGFQQLSTWQRDCSDISIAVIDSGVDMSHPQFQNITFNNPLDARLSDNLLSDEYGHGTHVTGLLAAEKSADNNAEGACSNATVIPIRFLDRYGAGSVSDAIKGILWAIDNHAQVINHSWTIKSYSQALFDVVKEADQLGLVQIAAAGNIGTNNDHSPIYPAAFSADLSGFIAVANWDGEKQTLYDSSNYGLTSVDIAASGTNVLSLAPNNGTKIRTGSSMSAPLVSAAVAMLKQQDTNLSAAQIRSILQLSSQPEAQLTHKVRASGRLNATAAINYNKNTTNLLIANIDNNLISLDGVGFLDNDQWQFKSATLPAKTFPLQPLSFSAQQVTFNFQELVNGYWQLYRNDQLISELAYQPILAQPSDLQAITNELGQLLSWRGSAMAQSYQIQAAIDDQSFITIAELAAPNNQLQHKLSDYSNVRYRIRASYDYQFNGDNLRSKYSLYSDLLTASAENVNNVEPLLWQSDFIASIPQGAEAIISLQLAKSEQGGFFELLDDPDNLILALSTDGQLRLNTEHPLSSLVTIAYNYDNKRNIKQLALSIHADENWLLPINNEEQFSLMANGFKINSWQRLVDGNYQIDGIVTDTQPLLSINLDSLGRQFDSVSVHDSGELIAAEQLAMNAKQLNINLPVNNSESYDSKRVLIELNLRAKNESTDSRCFIASSVYPHQPQKLHKLRVFRDSVLLKIPGGEMIVSAYYRYSPILVEALKDSPTIKNILKGILDLFL